MIQQLSTTAAAKLARIGRTATAETADSLRDLLIKHEMFPFDSVVDTFLNFGGYTLPFPLEGRFKIYRLKDAIKSMKGNGEKSTDPQLFRMQYGESETIQSCFWMNGLGNLFCDETKMVDGIVQWIEAWSRNPSMNQWL